MTIGRTNQPNHCSTTATTPGHTRSRCLRFCVGVIVTCYVLHRPCVPAGLNLRGCGLGDSSRRPHATWPSPRQLRCATKNQSITLPTSSLSRNQSPCRFSSVRILFRVPSSVRICPDLAVPRGRAAGAIVAEKIRVSSGAGVTDRLGRCPTWVALLEADERG